MRKNKPAQLLFFILALCIFTLSLGQFSTVYKFDQGSIYAFDILIALFDALGIFYLLATKKGSRVPLSLICLLTFTGLGAASLALTPLNMEPTEFLVSASYLARFFSYIIFALITWNFVKNGLFQVDDAHRVIIYSGFFLFAAGIFQLLVLPDLETLNPLLGWDPHKNRMVSTFFDPNFLGMYFVICLSLSLKRKSSIRLPSLLIFLLGIFLTFSRSAWLATAVLIFVAGLKDKALLIASVSIVLLAIFAVPRVQTRISGITDPQDSANFRLTSWQNTWKIIKENWVFGVGYNAFRYAQRDFGFLEDTGLTSRSGAGSDSSLLLVWATSGIFGLIFFTGYFALTSLSALKRTDLITAGLILALLVDSLFINSLFYPQVITAALLADMFSPS